jgi:hypothetical protein
MQMGSVGNEAYVQTKYLAIICFVCQGTLIFPAREPFSCLYIFFSLSLFECSSESSTFSAISGSAVSEMDFNNNIGDVKKNGE